MVLLQEHKELLDRLVYEYGTQYLVQILTETEEQRNPKKLINFWKETVKNYLGIIPFINWGRSINAVKRAQKQLTDSQIEKIIEYYMEWYQTVNTDEHFKPQIDINMALSSWFCNLWLKDKGQYE
jgi:hypothetical protein